MHPAERLDTLHTRGCSIVIPAYDVEPYLAAAVDSALGQTYAPLEVVIVDDGSTDGTPAVIDRYRDHPAVRAVRQENRGLAAARNRGIAEGRGAFVALLDADDLYLPTRVERCVEVLDAHPDVGFVTTDMYILDDHTPTARRWYRDIEAVAFPEAYGEQLRRIAETNFVAVPVVLRRAEDYDLWIRLLLGGVRGACVDEPLAYYRLRAGSLSANREAQWDAHLTVLERHLPALAQRGGRPRPVDGFALARRRAAQGDPRAAARFALMAARGRGARPRNRAAMAVAAARWLAADRLAGRGLAPRSSARP